MPDFFELPREDQREALLVAAEHSGRPLHLLEKDVWVVWALHHLFTGPHAQHLVFKGGTSRLTASFCAFPKTWTSPTTSAPLRRT